MTTCWHCGRSIRLRKDGNLYDHKPTARPSRPAPGSPAVLTPWCPGGGTPPDPGPYLLGRLATRLEDCRFSGGTEAELEDLVSLRLRTLELLAGLPVRRQEPLGPKDRPDFLVGHPGHVVAVELKVAGSPGAALRQVHSYACYPELCAVALVTTKATHRRAIPATVAGKPTRTFYLGAL